MNNFCTRYKLFVCKILLFAILLSATPPASSWRKVAFWSLIKISMYRTYYTNRFPVPIIFNLSIVILVSMHFSCIRDKFFGSLFHLLNF